MRCSSFIFKENRVLIEEEDNPSYNAVIVEEEIDGIGNLVDLPRVMFIDEECGQGQMQGLPLLPMQHPKKAHINFQS